MMKKSVACAVLVATATSAANADVKQYVSGKVALVSPTLHEDMTRRIGGATSYLQQDTGMATTLGFGVAYGIKLSDFRIELEGNSHAGSSDEPDAVRIYNTSAILNGYYDWALSEKFWIYGGLGFGYNRAVLEINGLDDIVGGGFAWQLSLGVAFELTDSLTADLGYRYFDGGSVDYNITAGSNFLNYTAGVTYGEFKAGLRYEF